MQKERERKIYAVVLTATITGFSMMCVVPILKHRCVVRWKSSPPKVPIISAMQEHRSLKRKSHLLQPKGSKNLQGSNANYQSLNGY